MPFKDRHPNEVIEAALRTRICLHSSDDLLLLHEGKIAEEFGVSRTPVRQILQKLAYDQLVETRPGIGTIAAPLVEGMFERDLKTTQAMLSACASVAQHPTPRSTQFSLVALSAMSMNFVGGAESKGAFIDIALRFLDILTPTITDPLLANGYTASYLRIIRWRMRMFEKDPDVTWERIIALIEAAAEATNRSEPGAIFLAIYAQAKSPRYSPWQARSLSEEPRRTSNVQSIR